MRMHDDAKPAKTLRHPKFLVEPCQTIPSSDPVPRNLPHRQISERQSKHAGASSRAATIPEVSFSFHTAVIDVGARQRSSEAAKVRKT